MSDDVHELLEYYRQILLIRRFEEEMIRQAGHAPGLNHACIGQEAVAVGACAALMPEDQVLTAHRPNGHILAKGAQPALLMAELFGKATGCCSGKGGNMHLLAPEVGVLGANGIVGGNLPLAVGVALTSRVKQSGKVVACFFGEGATNGGPFHESMNLAAIWKLPLIFICENNQYAVTVPLALSTSVERIAERGSSYRMPTATVDGNDVMAVRAAVAEARARAARGDGPTLVECLTYRLRGHYEGEQQDLYRSTDEIEAAWRAEPLSRTAGLLKGLGVTTETLDSIEKQVDQIITESVTFALESPFPDPRELYTDVFES